VATPAHAASGPSTAVRVRRLAYWVLGVDFAALAALGLWLAFRYEPGSGSASGAHAVLGAIAVVAALVAAIATVADDDRPVSGIVPAVVLLGIVAGLYLTGPTLGWDALSANGPTGPQRGVTVVFDKHVGAVAQGNKQMTAQTYRRYAWLHTLALPVAVLVIGGSGLWAARRRRNYAPARIALDDEVVDIR
jgi:quinol-cytochrome oxidoreductase complex cytochrome b subunit